ncbi:MAG: peptidase S9, partial [Stenotrophomonas maltophilia]
MRRTILAAALAALGCVAIGGAGAVDLSQYVRQEAFTDIKISPTGEYVAATVPLEDATAIVVLRLKDKQMVGNFRPPDKNHAYEFDWVSDERLLIGLAQKWGSLDQPNPTGELYAINANGNRGELLVGYRVESKGPGTRIQPKKVEAVAAFLADDLPDDERNVLVTVWPLSEDPFTRVDRMDVTSGRRSRVASSPVRRGEFTTDGAGEVRFVHGAGSDNVNKLYFRERSGDNWKLINDEAVSKRIETA